MEILLAVLIGLSISTWLFIHYKDDPVVKSDDGYLSFYKNDKLVFKSDYHKELLSEDFDYLIAGDKTHSHEDMETFVSDLDWESQTINHYVLSNIDEVMDLYDDDVIVRLSNELKMQL